MKYRCKICNYMYDEEEEKVPFLSLEDSYVCPMCFGPKEMFQVYDESQMQKKSRVFQYAIQVDENNLGIEKEDAKCIDCGMCRQTCKEKCGLDFKEDTSQCLACGQCILTCPTNALRPKNAIDRVRNALQKGKVGICYTSPATRVSIGEAFGYEPGTFFQGKLVALLKKLGFTYVFDTTFGADLTVMEEAKELVTRIQENGVFPMFSSCCPAWVKYCHQFYPELKGNLSSCKSPISMQGAMIAEYFLPKIKKDRDDVIQVAITPCTAKKMEIRLEGLEGTDEVITIQELVKWANEEQISFSSLEDASYDSFFQEGSGAGTIFGSTGGVCIATLRTAYHYLTNKDLDLDQISFHEIQGMENVKEATVMINDMPIHVAVVHKISAMKPFLADILFGKKQYHFIEVMNCEGGCVGGGGQPKLELEQAKEGKRKRLLGLYQRDTEQTVRFSYQNPDIKRVYQEFLEHPGSTKSKKLLHVPSTDEKLEV